MLDHGFRMAGSTINQEVIINQEVMHVPVHLKCENIATVSLCLLIKIMKSKNKI